MLSPRHVIQQSWLLIVSSFGFGLLIAVTSTALSPRIEQNRINKLNRLARGLLPDAKDFVPVEPPIEIDTHGGKTPVDVYRAMAGDRCVGWSFNAIGSGFADKIELIIAVDGNFTTLAGYDVVFSNETPRIGDKIKHDYYREQFVGVPVGKMTLVRSGDATKVDSEIVAISGATMSSQYVVDIINRYLPAVKEQIETRGLLSNGR